MRGLPAAHHPWQYLLMLGAAARQRDLLLLLLLLLLVGMARRERQFLHHLRPPGHRPLSAWHHSSWGFELL